MHVPDRPQPQLDVRGPRARRGAAVHPRSPAGGRERPDPRDGADPGDVRDRRRGRPRDQPRARRTQTPRRLRQRPGPSVAILKRGGHLAECLNLGTAAPRSATLTTAPATTAEPRSSPGAARRRGADSPSGSRCAARPGARLPARLLGLPAALQPRHLVLRVDASRATQVHRARQLPLAVLGPGVLAAADHGAHGRRRRRRPVVLGTALALFFDLNLRGVVARARRAHRADAADAVVVGLMWRALLNPDWGMVNWLLGGIGCDTPPTGSPIRRSPSSCSSSWTVAVDPVRVHHRVRPPAGAARGHLRGGRGGRRRRRGVARHITLPLLAPAIVFAAIFRAIDAFRTFDLVYGLTYGGPGRTTTTLASTASRTGSASPATATRRRSPTSWWSSPRSPRRCCCASTCAGRTPGERDGRSTRLRSSYLVLVVIGADRRRAVRVPRAAVDQAPDRHPRGAAVARHRLGRRSARTTPTCSSNAGS